MDFSSSKLLDYKHCIFHENSNNHPQSLYQLATVSIFILLFSSNIDYFYKVAIKAVQIISFSNSHLPLTYSKRYGIQI